LNAQSLKRLLLILMLLTTLIIFGCGDDDDDDDDNDDAADDDDVADDDDDNGDDDDVVDDDDDNDDNDTIDKPINMFIGTGGLGFGSANLLPSPQMPNGMIKPGPDTGIGTFAIRFQHFGGYWYHDTHVRGFSHTHMVGVGANDMGVLRIMPVTGIDNERVSDKGYVSPYSHDNESAELGYYQVYLPRYEINAEMTTGNWSTIHRFTYTNTTNDPYLVIDASASIMPDQIEDASVQIDEINNEVSGFSDIHGGFTGRYGGLITYFVIRFSEPITDFGTFSDDVIDSGNTDVAGVDVGAYVGFGSAKSPVLVKVGISYQSVAQARANLDAEIPDFDFEAVRTNLESAWAEKLDFIDVKGGSYKQRHVFYTALYHVYMMPTLFTEANDEYLGFDYAAHEVDDFTYYTDMSIWDTFRSLHPLMTLIDPDVSRDFVVSLVKMYEQGGDLPRWPQGRSYGGSMIGTHADSVITEAYIKGITDFDVETAYEGMYLHATEERPKAGRSDMDHYTTIGYCTFENTSGSESKTLEYAYDDYCVATLADLLGYTADADELFAQSDNYENLWDPATQFFRGKDVAGNFKEPFFPMWPSEEYTEGNAWQYLWFVPHDVPNLINLFGSTQSFIKKLEIFFEEATKLPDHFLFDPMYWHGNEPDIHAVYMFNEAGRPDLAQKYVRWIMDARYRNAPDGIDGNDDGGTLSAWYIFSALGFFPVNPCDGRYMIGSPLFDEATVRLAGGDLVITAENNSEANMYVQSVKLNGVTLTDMWFHHDDIANGGTLEFVMGPNPAAR
jgi:predicted alpha-1,2-mannosidase